MTTQNEGKFGVEKIKALFIHSLEGRTAKIRQAARVRDWAGVEFVAHQIRGTAGAFELHELADNAGDIEDAIRGGESEDTIIEYCDKFARISDDVIATAEDLGSGCM